MVWAITFKPVSTIYFRGIPLAWMCPLHSPRDPSTFPSGIPFQRTHCTLWYILSPSRHGWVWHWQFLLLQLQCHYSTCKEHLFVLTKITKIFFPSYYYNDFLSFTDVSVSYIPLVSESVPHKWFDSRHKKPYFPILFLWLLLGNVLSNAYRSNLLAVLVKVDFEKQPETFQDLLDQKLEMYIMSNTVATLLLKYSPFERHRRVFQECLLDRGGYYESPPQGTPEVLARMRVY